MSTNIQKNSIRTSKVRCYETNEVLNAFERFKGKIVHLNQKKEVLAQELAKNTKRLLKELVAHGLERGDRVIISIRNGAPLMAAFFAVLEHGGSPILQFWQSPEGELCRMVEQWHVRFILTDRMLKFEPSTIFHDNKIYLDDPFCYEWYEYKLRHDSKETYPALPGVSLLPTSGTSGIPKLAVRPQYQLNELMCNYIETMKMDSGSIILCVTPMSHAYAFEAVLLSALYTSSTILTSWSFHPLIALKALNEFNVTMFPSTPNVLDYMVKVKSEISFKSNLQTRFITAGSTLSSKIASEFANRYHILPCQLYGTTETGIISYEREAVEGHLSVGLPIKGVEIRLQMDDGCLENEDGQIGELHIKTKAMMGGYLIPERIDNSVFEDGWFNTGDLAKLDEDGNIYLLGRKKDTINVSGLKVVPSEVEAVICKIEGIEEVKVYGGHVQDNAEFVKAAVVATKPVRKSEILSFCRNHLSAYKIPQQIFWLQKMPRTPSGKIMHNELP